MECHSPPHYVGYFVETPVVKPLHCVEDATLHGLEAVFNVRNGAFEDYV